MKSFENESVFVVLVDRQKRGPRKHWHTSKKCRQIGVFLGLVWTVETDDANPWCKHSVTLFQRYYRDTSTWNPLESSYFKATKSFQWRYLTRTCQSTLLVSSTISRYHFLNRLGPGAEARNSERSQFARRIISCLFFSGKNSEYCFVSVTN